MTEAKQKQKQEKDITRYLEGVEQLAAALNGLSEENLDLSRAPGKWTIRQIVHHIADAEDIWKMCIKAALGNPGCKFDMNWYIVDNKCAEPLDYAHRPISGAVELFNAARRHVVEMVNHLPGARDQTFIITRSDLPPEGKTFTVGEVIRFQNLHLTIHIKQIRGTRQEQKI